MTGTQEEDQGEENEFPFRDVKVSDLLEKCDCDQCRYPKNLKGAEIPLACRIVAIADVFDALTSKRPYKEPFAVEKSLAIIREGRGIQFDPDVVDAFFAIQDEILAIMTRYADTAQPVGDMAEMSHVVLKKLLQQYNLEKANLLAAP